jgi:cobalt/nickel transport system permease protein
MDKKNLTLFIVGGLIVALGLAFFVSPFASGSPDGLNKVAIDQGFDATQGDHALDDSPLAGYAVEGVHDQSLSKGLSGIIGVAITFGVGMIVFASLRAYRHRHPATPAQSTGT